MITGDCHLQPPHTVVLLLSLACLVVVLQVQVVVNVFRTNPPPLPPRLSPTSPVPAASRRHSRSTSALSTADPHGQSGDPHDQTIHVPTLPIMHQPYLCWDFPFVFVYQLTS